ncbi:MAG: hypothetical protein Aurels2KO_25550 [Aureliella sp.]
MTKPNTFTQREVQRSFRKFNDLVDDLMSSKFQTWGDTMTRLVTHCETDPVMQVVTEPLKTDPRVNARKWWDDAVASVRGMVGSGNYSLPADDDERTALLYQVLLVLENEEVDVSRFCTSVYGHTKYQDMVDTFNRELVYKFTREVSYRLDEVAQDNAGQQEISRDAIVVFHHHDYSTTISGSIQGSNFATGNAQVSGATATFESHSDVAAELRAMKSIAAEFSKANRATIESALEFLASQTDSQTPDIAEIGENARALVEISPTLKTRLMALVSGAGASVVGSAIIEGIKHALGG